MENGKLKMENGKWKIENGKLKIESGKWKVENGEWRMESSMSPLSLSGDEKPLLVVSSLRMQGSPEPRINFANTTALTSNSFMSHSHCGQRPTE